MGLNRADFDSWLERMTQEQLDQVNEIVIRGEHVKEQDWAYWRGCVEREIIRRMRKEGKWLTV